MNDSAVNEQETIETSEQDTVETMEQGPENKGPLETCLLELTDMKSRFMYLSAEFENYKKRITKDQAFQIEQAQDQALLDLLAVSDDLERALIGVAQVSEEAASHFKGFELIVKNIAQLLKKYGIEEIVVEKEFDPSQCEAVMQQESSEHESGQIVVVLQKGYLRKGRVLRPAKVSVAL